MKTYFFTIFTGLLFFGFIKSAAAVPPPDFIFNIGSQIVQIFTFLLLAFSIALGSVKRFFQSHILFVKYGKFMWVFLAVLVIALSLGGAYYYEKYRQEKTYKDWVEQSKNQQPESKAQSGGLDKLQIGQMTPLAGARGEMPADAGADFINSYYSNLDKGNFAAAYAVSSQTVDFETYKSWYKDTEKVNLDSLQKISENTYSLGLTLTEGPAITRYAVLMKLKNLQNGFKIENSTVRVLASTPLANTALAPEKSNFFEANKNLPISISNEEFSESVLKTNGVYILDAREDEEFEIGKFPGSVHIRFADIIAGEWITIPEDKVIYVVCWSGIRGKEVAEFLRSKNILARFLDKGADGWVTFGGKWEGGIKFLSKYQADQYQIVFSTEEVKKYEESGVILVDSRQPEKYQKSHIAGSISIPIIYTPSSQIKNVLSQVPPNKQVITVCDDFVSCFDAKVTGVKLEKNGHIFLGRYNKPWEY